MKRKGERGQVIAEAALMLPVLVFIALAMIDIQWAVRDAADVEYIVNESARCEAIGSQACVNNNATLTYAQSLAANMRLSSDRLTTAVPQCNGATCTVNMTYRFKPLGVWFPGITIVRTGTAAQPPPE
jgi:hypothetical protein